MSAKCFVSFGNPLMDTTVEIEDSHLLDKYGFVEDQQAEIDADTMESLLKDLKDRLQDYPELLPGRCVCLVRGERRTAVAHIGAAGRYSLERLIESRETQLVLDEASIVHVEGFFLSDRFPVCQYVVREIQKARGKPLCYSVGAVYVIRQFRSESQYMAERADLVFGTRMEYEALGEIYGSKTGEECILKLHELGVSNGSNDRMATHGKIVVMTDGSKPVVVAWGRDVVQMNEYPVAELSPDKIVDTTGAGDAFLAGFAWGLMNGQSIDACAKFAGKLAATVIGYIGIEAPPGTRYPTLEEVV